MSDKFLSAIRNEIVVAANHNTRLLSAILEVLRAIEKKMVDKDAMTLIAETVFDMGESLESNPQNIAELFVEALENFEPPENVINVQVNAPKNLGSRTEIIRGSDGNIVETISKPLGENDFEVEPQELLGDET